MLILKFIYKSSFKDRFPLEYGALIGSTETGVPCQQKWTKEEVSRLQQGREADNITGTKFIKHELQWLLFLRVYLSHAAKITSWGTAFFLPELSLSTMYLGLSRLAYSILSTWTDKVIVASFFNYWRVQSKVYIEGTRWFLNWAKT